MSEQIEINIHSKAFRDDMHNQLRQARGECPVKHSDALGGFWAVTRYEDICAAARDSATFSSAKGATLPRVVKDYQPIPLESDPPEHVGYRKVVQALLSKQAVRQYEEPLREFVTEILDRLVPEGRADLIPALARPVPLQALTLLLGIPPQEHGTISALTEDVLSAASEGRQGDQAAASERYLAFLRSQLEAHRDAEQKDALSMIAQAKVGDRHLTETEQIGMAYLLVLAGHDTTVGAIGIGLSVLASDPVLRDRLVAGPELIPAFVDESLRMETPVPSMARLVTADTELGGQPMKAGDQVVLFWTSANRDEAQFSHPDTFDMDRPDNRHLAFGYGRHRCQGEFLARLELEIVFEEVLKRMPRLRLAPDAAPDSRSGFANGPLSLPAEW